VAFAMLPFGFSVLLLLLVRRTFSYFTLTARQ